MTAILALIGLGGCLLVLMAIADEWLPRPQEPLADAYWTYREPKP